MNRPGLAERWKAVALLGGGSAIFFWQLRHPIIRLEWPVANEILGFALGLCLPWLTAAAIFRIGRWWSKTIALIAVIPLLLYSAVFLLGSAMTGFAYRDGRDLSFDRVAETHWKGSEVRCYRTNGGATTDFGVVIRQERSLIPAWCWSAALTISIRAIRSTRQVRTWASLSRMDAPNAEVFKNNTAIID